MMKIANAATIRLRRRAFFAAFGSGGPAVGADPQSIGTVRTIGPVGTPPPGTAADGTAPARSTPTGTAARRAGTTRPGPG